MQPTREFSPVVRVGWVERVLTVEFGPSRSKRFRKGVEEAQSGAGECSELEAGSYRVRFVLGSDGGVYTSLARLLQRLCNSQATEVYEDDLLVSSYQARDIRVSGCPKIAISPSFARAGESTATNIAGSTEVRRRCDAP
jgi:hypothetical protein